MLFAIRILELLCFCSQDSVHTATPNEEKSTIVCTVTGKICKSRLTSSQKVWLGSSGEFVPNSCVTTEIMYFNPTGAHDSKLGRLSK